MITPAMPMIGRRFDRLLVIETGVRVPGNDWSWRVRCDCGVEKMIRGKNLRRGRTRSCGCLQREVAREQVIGFQAVHYHHGHAARGSRASLTYRSWGAMIQRCTKPTHPQHWHYYGSRGITVCDRWRDFAAFLEDMGERPVGRSLDRIDNDGDYEPGNCRWATAKEQANNKRRCQRD